MDDDDDDGAGTVDDTATSTSTAAESAAIPTTSRKLAPTILEPSVRRVLRWDPLQPDFGVDDDEDKAVSEGDDEDDELILHPTSHAERLKVHNESDGAKNKEPKPGAGCPPEREGGQSRLRA